MEGTKERSHEDEIVVFDLLILLTPDADGRYGISAEDWDCDRVEIWIDSQKVNNPVGIVISSSLVDTPAKVRIIRRDPLDASKTITETYRPDMLLIERKKK